MTDSALLTRIEDFLGRAQMSPTAFGKASVGDPNFVRDLKAGREPKRRLVEKVDAYIRANAPAPLVELAESRSDQGAPV